MQHLKLILLAIWVSGCAFYVEGFPNGPSSSQQENEEFKNEQTKFLESVDEILQRGTCNDYREAQRLLLERCNEYGENSPVLWRLAKYCFLLKMEDENCSPAEKEELTEQGLKYAQNALQYNDHDADAHKWFGILMANKGSTLGMKGKIECGHIFKQHIDRAIEINADDPSLRLLNGIFLYELGKLSWFEKAIANTFFGTIPQASIREAIEEFHRANSLNGNKPWKMNCIYLAKCYHKEGCPALARRWLDAAEDIQVKTAEDKQAEKRIASFRKTLNL